MLARDDEQICKVAFENIRVAVIHGDTDWVVGIDGGLTDDVFGVVVHGDDAEEVLALVGFAGFRFGQVEGAGAWDVDPHGRGADAVGDAVGCFVSAVF